MLEASAMQLMDLSDQIEAVQAPVRSHRTDPRLQPPHSPQPIPQPDSHFGRDRDPHCD